MKSYGIFCHIFITGYIMFWTKIFGRKSRKHIVTINTRLPIEINMINILRIDGWAVNGLHECCSSNTLVWVGEFVAFKNFTNPL